MPMWHNYRPTSTSLVYTLCVSALSDSLPVDTLIHGPADPAISRALIADKPARRPLVNPDTCDVTRLASCLFIDFELGLVHLEF